MKHAKVRMLTEAALMIAAAQILGYIKLWRMPWGGSVVLSMVPMILFAIRWGVGAGLLSGLAFGVLQVSLDGGFAIGWQSIIGDYLLAYTVLGLAGLWKGKESAPLAGTLAGCGARFLVHYVVGATIWAEYMPETFLGLSMGSPWWYSLLYNLLYMLPNTILTLLVFLVMKKPLRRYLLGEDLTGM